MAGGLGVLLLPLLAGLGSTGSDLDPPSNIRVVNQKGNLSVTWDWICRSEDNMKVNFTVFYQKLGMAASEIPGCVHIDEYVCSIPSELLDFSKRYWLHVRVETLDGDKESDPVNFQPHLMEQIPIPTIHLVLDDGLVSIHISTSVHPVFARYIVVVQNMNSSTESLIRQRLSSFEILFTDLHVDVIYCLRAQIYDIRREMRSPFSAERCFKVPKGLPENLRVEGINTRYLLKWDWDYRHYPNVTFSVKKSYLSQSNWRTVEGCEHITTSECNVSGIDLFLRHKFLVSVYNDQTDERNSNIVPFHPIEDTVMGPPTNLKLMVQNNDLYITVGAPEGFGFLHQYCTWVYHLESWKNSTPTDVNNMDVIGPHFKISDVEASTTYCARAYIQCTEGHRRGLYSEIYCITSASRSYMKQWIIGLVFGIIIVISIILYICLCPLKRYLKHVFFPKSKLPSSIEKGLQDSPRSYIKTFFLLHEEETTDKCYIMQNSPVDGEATIDKNSSGAKGRDSGNYSNEDEVTGDSAAAGQ